MILKKLKRTSFKKHKAVMIAGLVEYILAPEDEKGGEKTLWSGARNFLAHTQAGRKAEMIIKVNSLSDKTLILKLYEAANAGVDTKMIVRGIYCAVNQKSFKEKIHAISIVDEYLEHARVMYFYNKGAENMYISSADWMTRNLDYRIEAAVPILQKNLKKELKELLEIQLQDNVKARILDKNMRNEYVESDKNKKIRSQIEIYNYLKNQKY